MASGGRKQKELDLYSWSQTRPRSDLTLRMVVDKVGRATDIALHLVPAFFALLLVLMAYQMAESGRYSGRADTPTSVRTELRQPGSLPSDK